MASSFPISVDNFKKLQDISQNQAEDIARYKTLREKTVLTSEEEAELSALKASLSSVLIEITDWNDVTDAIINIQSFFLNDVDTYINTKKTEFQIEIDKFDHKDLYDNGVTYQKWNVVVYDNETFISKINNNIGNTDNRPLLIH